MSDTVLIKQLLAIINAQDKLLAAYRLGGRPPEKALDTLRGKDTYVAMAEMRTEGAAP